MDIDTTSAKNVNYANDYKQKVWLWLDSSSVTEPTKKSPLNFK